MTKDDVHNLRCTLLHEFDKHWNHINKGYVSAYPLAYDMYFSGVTQALEMIGLDPDDTKSLFGPLLTKLIPPTTH